jgi:hypothetical protein
MRNSHTKTLLAVAALALGLAGQAAAQAPSVPRRPPATHTQKPAAGSVKVIQTDQPAEETPAADSTTAQTTAPPSPQAAPQATAATGGQMREEMGVTATRDWLALVDAGQFPESYDAAGDLFRGSLPREQWAAALGKSRTPRGNVVQRNLKSVVVSKDLPNAPKGTYVITTFDTKFQQDPEPQWEVATTYLDQSGHWKVVGYVIKPQDNAQAQKPPQ